MRHGAVWIIVRGGLGNQMFQIAFGAALSARFGLPVKYVDVIARDGTIRKWEVQCFGVSAERLSRQAELGFKILLSAQRRFGPHALGRLPGIWTEDVDSARPVTRRDTPRIVSGFWQRPHYFEDVEGSVREQFRFPALPKTRELSLAGRGMPKVAIHVRLGDYVSTPEARQERLTCSPDWYRAAWQEMRYRLGPCHAFVFSEDVSWVKNEIGFDGSVDYVSSDASDDAWIDMARMSSCDHFIISNSSYSWWAAYLSASPRKIVIAPKRWVGWRDTARFGICPSSWILL
jgi:hypothetical protein